MGNEFPNWEIPHSEGKYLLSGVKEKFDEWNSKNYNIYIITARGEGWRELTEYQLQFYGLKYKQLIMDVGRGKRFLINDLKPYVEGDAKSAFAINLERDSGIAHLTV